MHIPDGFISPQTYLPLDALSIGLWYVAFKKAELKNEQITFVAVLAALSFVLMLIAIPLPGGTSAHLSGVALLALLFSPYLAFGAISLVVVIEALFFGEGGVTTIGVNVLAIAFLGSFSAYFTYRLLRRFSHKAALFAAGWMGVNVPALFIAAVLGIQPLIASAEGKPLFFPFDLATTLWALMVPHAMIGVAEGVLTVVLYEYLQKNFKTVFHEDK